MSVQYATATDFQNRYGAQETLALTRLENPTATTIDTALLDRRLQDASALVQGYMPAGLTAPYPTIVVTKTCEIARGLLDRNRRREDVQLDYDAALKWCEDVAKGLFKIPGIEAAQRLPVRGSMEVFSVKDEDQGDFYRGYKLPRNAEKY